MYLQLQIEFPFLNLHFSFFLGQWIFKKESLYSESHYNHHSKMEDILISDTGQMNIHMEKI